MVFTAFTFYYARGATEVGFHTVLSTEVDRVTISATSCMINPHF